MLRAVYNEETGLLSQKYDPKTNAQLVEVYTGQNKPDGAPVTNWVSENSPHVDYTSWSLTQPGKIKTAERIERAQQPSWIKQLAHKLHLDALTPHKN